MSKLSRKVAVITGGSSGLGLAMAKRFADEGAFVYITGRRRAELDKAVSSIGANVAGVQGDVQRIEDIDRLIERVRQEKGRIDVPVANSGIVDPQPVADATEENFDATFGINVRGLYFTVNRAFPLLGQGSLVILVSSIAANKGVPGYGTYTASKAAVRGFARTWTAELLDRGIRVNTISPGPFDTPIMDVQADTPEGRDAVRAVDHLAGQKRWNETQSDQLLAIEREMRKIRFHLNGLTSASAIALRQRSLLLQAFGRRPPNARRRLSSGRHPKPRTETALPLMASLDQTKAL